MSTIINLRQFKKQKLRAEKEQLAQENRVVHGRTKAEKNFARSQTQKAKNFLDHNRLERADKAYPKKLATDLEIKPSETTKS